MAAGAAVVTASAVATQGARIPGPYGRRTRRRHGVLPARSGSRAGASSRRWSCRHCSSACPSRWACSPVAASESPDLALLAALYVGFVGRIVLKDFRDVVGDRLFGKRTFLVRHGRRTTCVLSAACWVGGTDPAGRRDARCHVVVRRVPGDPGGGGRPPSDEAGRDRLSPCRRALHLRTWRSSAAARWRRCSWRSPASAPAAAAFGVVGLTALSLLVAEEMLRLGPRQVRVTVTDPRRTSRAVDKADAGSSSSALRGLREPANGDTASVFSRPEPSIRQ